MAHCLFVPRLKNSPDDSLLHNRGHAANFPRSRRRGSRLTPSPLCAAKLVLLRAFSPLFPVGADFDGQFQHRGGPQACRASADSRRDCEAPTDFTVPDTGLTGAAGIPESVVFHVLRHSLTSWLLATGVSLKTIQARLGHQDFGTTANTYSHILEGAQAEAVAKVDELMSRVKNRR